MATLFFHDCEVKWSFDGQKCFPCGHDLTNCSSLLSISCLWRNEVPNRQTSPSVPWRSEGWTEVAWFKRTDSSFNHDTELLQQNRTTTMDWWRWWWCQRQNGGQSRKTFVANTVSDSERGLKWGRIDWPAFPYQEKIRNLHHPKTWTPPTPPPPTIGPVSSGFFRFVSFAASVSFHFAERMDDSSVPSFQWTSVGTKIYSCRFKNCDKNSGMMRTGSFWIFLELLKGVFSRFSQTRGQNAACKHP